MKKILCILLALSLLAWLGVNLYKNNPRNIFDEMYLEVKKTYQTNNILGQIEDFDIIPTWPTDGEYNRQLPFGRYQKNSLSGDYYDVVIAFNMRSQKQDLFISFERWLDSGERLAMWSHYSFREKKLVRTVKIAIPNSVSADYIEEEDMVKAYLQENGITASDLDNYYNEIINEKILKDWLSIYDSQYSPTDYGEITVETQWAEW